MPDEEQVYSYPVLTTENMEIPTFVSTCQGGVMPNDLS
jgi:hypothetical protein